MTLIVQNSAADAEIARRVALPWPNPGYETNTPDALVPALTSIAPTTGVHLGTNVALTATGTAFAPGAAVAQDAVKQTSTRVSAVSVTSSMVAASQPAAITRQVTIVNQNGIASEPKPFVWT